MLDIPMSGLAVGFRKSGLPGKNASDGSLPLPTANIPILEATFGATLAKVVRELKQVHKMLICIFSLFDLYTR